MNPRLPQLRDAVADAITYHPGNRTGTPEQRHPVSLMLADTVLSVVRPCTCDGDPIECSHETARGQAEALVAQVRDAAEDMRQWCSPDGFAARCADHIISVLDQAARASGYVLVRRADLETRLDQRNGHAHQRPGIWDDDNPPHRAGKRCVECAAETRLRAALDRKATQE